VDQIAVFQQPAGLGSGFSLVVEAAPGSSGQAPGSIEFTSTPGVRPDFQILSNRDLGFGDGEGSAEVCDNGPLPELPLGGVPGFDPPNFDPLSEEVTDALNDFGCRFANSTDDPCILDDGDNPIFASTGSIQFCTGSTISRGLEFPNGDTLLVVQWRDTAGNIGTLARIIVRVL